MGLAKTTLNPPQSPAKLIDKQAMHRGDQLLEKARADTGTVLKELESQLDGLTEPEAISRLRQYGSN